MEIRIKDKKLVEMVREKEKMVEEGRAVSVQLESIDAQLEILKEKEKEYSSQVVPEDLIVQGEALRVEINAKAEELQNLANKIHEMKLNGIPEDIKEQHIALAKEKDALEKTLNKIGLKIEKFKSKYIPKIQKIARPKLGDDPFEDLETSKLDGDEIVVTTFSHLENFKKRFIENRQ